MAGEQPVDAYADVRSHAEVRAGLCPPHNVATDRLANLREEALRRPLELVLSLSGVQLGHCVVRSQGLGELAQGVEESGHVAHSVNRIRRR